MIPEKIKLQKGSNQLLLRFAGCDYALPAEYLRVNSPSAEVQGHGPGQAVLQYGKRHVRLTRVEPVGNYALKLVFDDGRDSGIYSWHYLHQLASEQSERWQAYLDALHQQQKTRDPETSVVRFVP